VLFLGFTTIAEDNIMQSTMENIITEEKAFRFYLENTQKLLESELSNLISKHADLRLSGKIEQILLSHGKRFRALLVILSAQSVGANREDVIALAMAFELLHTATLVHDDILDQDKFRRHELAAHEKWSVNDAILIGDALIALAVNLIADYGREIMKITSETGLALCDGEYMDVSMTSIKLSEKEYLEKIGKKSASLFHAASRCGAMAGGGSNFEVKCLTDFGEHIGIAYQISDDLLDIFLPSEDAPKDLRKLRISLPLIHLFKESNFVERKILLKDIQTLINEDGALKKEAIARILQNLKAKDSRFFCRKKVNEYVDRAIADIQSLKESDFKVYLLQFAEMLRTS
jgi:geranylgeranyl pyrophosphate synthase